MCVCAAECASFKKTCLLEGVTSQWRYERGKGQRERGREQERGQREARGRESDREREAGKVGQEEKWKEKWRKVTGGSVSGSLGVDELLYMHVYMQ